MQQVLAIALVAMQQDMRRLDSIAGNLANVSTPAYKREIVAAKSFVDAFEDAAVAGTFAPGTANGDSLALPPGAMTVMLDSRPGTLKTTGQPLDLAIASEGFFEVTTNSGPAYTRQGNFQVDARGRLVTAQGEPVMGKAGEIYLTTQTPVIDAAGNITEPDATSGPAAASPGTPIAQLKVVRFDKPGEMQRLGGGLMNAGNNMTPMADADVRLRQAALENGNVSSTQEMVHLIQTMRHVESMQKIAQGYDEMVGTAIRKLGDLS